MKSYFISIVLTAFLVFQGAVNLAKAALPVAVEGQAMPSLAPVLERVQRSLVTLSVVSNVQPQRRNDPFFNDPFFRRFFDQHRSNTMQRRQRNIGTGVIIDAERGLILTNEHLIDGARRIDVSLHDGREVMAKVLGSDKMSDVALIEVDADNIEALMVAQPDSLAVGDFVISASHVLGVNSTFTSGIVSGLAKRGFGAQNYQSYIQSDAGAGAGVLLNLNGELVGLNLAKVAQTNGSARIGFSTPINTAIKIKDQIVNYGIPQRGFLAVQVQDLTRDLAVAFNIQQARGVVITNVVAGSSAAEAGIEVGDVVLKADEHAIDHGTDLRTVISSQFAGDPIQLTVLREGQTVVLPTVLESSTPMSRMDSMIHYRLEGATFRELTDQSAGTTQVANVRGGVEVVDVKRGSVAWEQGVRQNDVVVSANRKPVKDLDSFRQAIAEKDVLMLNIVRDDNALFLLLQ